MTIDWNMISTKFRTETCRGPGCFCLTTNASQAFFIKKNSSDAVSLYKTYCSTDFQYLKLSNIMSGVHNLAMTAIFNKNHTKFTGIFKIYHYTKFYILTKVHHYCHKIQRQKHSLHDSYIAVFYFWQN